MMNLDAGPQADPQGGQDPIAALVAALSQMGGLQDKQGLLTGQLAQNTAYMQPQSGQHSTGIGAALGGIGDTIRSGVGAYRQAGLNQQQQGLVDQQGQARGGYLQALMGALGGGGGQQPPLAPGAFQPTGI